MRQVKRVSVLGIERVRGCNSCSYDASRVDFLGVVACHRGASSLQPSTVTEHVNAVAQAPRQDATGKRVASRRCGCPRLYVPPGNFSLTPGPAQTFTRALLPPSPRRTPYQQCQPCTHVGTLLNVQ